MLVSLRYDEAMSCLAQLGELCAVFPWLEAARDVRVGQLGIVELVLEPVELGLGELDVERTRLAHFSHGLCLCGKSDGWIWKCR